MKNSGQQVSDYREYRLSAAEWLRYGAEGIVMAGVFAYVFYRSMPAFILFCIPGAAYPLFMKKELKRRRTEKLLLEFKEGIMALSAALSAGYSVENALTESVKELELMYGREGLASREFAYMAGQIRMNRTAEQVFLDFASRTGLDDIRNFAQIFAAAKRTGGELTKIVGDTARVIGDKIQVRKDIQALTASRRYEQKIMNRIPFFIVIYLDVTSPGFFDSLYGTILGRGVMTACLAVYGAAWAMADQILRIEI